MNVTFEQRGRVYLSVETIKEMAAVAGLLESHDALGKKLHDEANYNRGYKDGLKEGNELVSKLMGITSRLAVGDFSDVVHSVDPDEEQPEAAAGYFDNIQNTPVRKRK
jgi:hypothetical protein